jgi:hypothetical protein
MRALWLHVRLVPIRDSCIAAIIALFDHRIGAADQRQWHYEPLHEEVAVMRMHWRVNATWRDRVDADTFLGDVLRCAARLGLKRRLS